MSTARTIATTRSAMGIPTGRLAVWWVLVSEIVIFGGVLVSYVMHRLGHPEWGGRSGAHQHLGGRLQYAGAAHVEPLRGARTSGGRARERSEGGADALPHVSRRPDLPHGQGLRVDQRDSRRLHAPGGWLLVLLLHGRRAARLPRVRRNDRDVVRGRRRPEEPEPASRRERRDLLAASSTSSGSSCSRFCTSPSSTEEAHGSRGSHGSSGRRAGASATIGTT